MFRYDFDAVAPPGRGLDRFSSGGPDADGGGRNFAAQGPDIGGTPQRHGFAGSNNHHNTHSVPLTIPSLSQHVLEHAPSHTPSTSNQSMGYNVSHVPLTSYQSMGQMLARMPSTPYQAIEANGHIHSYDIVVVIVN